MKTLGEYQNNIQSLSSLSIESYERLFKLYSQEVGDKEQYYYNILRKVDLPENINTDFLEFYTTPTPMPLTIISHNIYNNQRLWWLILKLNKREIGDNIFTVPSGIKLKYIIPTALPIVFNQITKISVFNGRHY
jgi:hypothetical protein